jgi:hypothetical protein
MSEPHPPARQPGGSPDDRTLRRRDESLLRGGITGIAAVALATLALVVVGAVIAVVVAAIY